MTDTQSSYEDLQDNIRNLSMPDIETFENKYQDRDYTVEFEVPECTAICPKTGLPDFATLYVSYGPDKDLIELKSFKLYIVEYRNVGIFHENLVNKILDDFVKACKPKWARVEGVVNPRGGIITTVVANYPAAKNK